MRAETVALLLLWEKKSLWQTVKRINAICDWKTWRNFKRMLLHFSLQVKWCSKGWTLERPDSTQRPQSWRQDLCALYEAPATSRRQEGWGICQRNRNRQEKTNLKHSALLYLQRKPGTESNPSTHTSKKGEKKGHRDSSVRSICSTPVLQKRNPDFRLNFSGFWRLTFDWLKDFARKLFQRDR